MIVALGALLRRVWVARAIYGQAALGLGGWACLVAGTAHLLGGVVWYFGVALLCFALFGFKLLAVIVLRGLYVLAAEDPPK